jgi:hypothetical protein
MYSASGFKVIVQKSRAKNTMLVTHVQKVNCDVKCKPHHLLKWNSHNTIKQSGFACPTAAAAHSLVESLR